MPKIYLHFLHRNLAKHVFTFHLCNLKSNKDNLICVKISMNDSLHVKSLHVNMKRNSFFSKRKQLKKCFDVTLPLLMQIHCFCEKKTSIMEVPWEIENDKSCITLKKHASKFSLHFSSFFAVNSILTIKNKRYLQYS